MRTRFFEALAGGIFLGAIGLWAFFSRPGDDGKPAVGSTAEASGAGLTADFADPCSRALFFAVLEGLYEEGASNEVVDAILAIDPDRKGYLNFVAACPLCTPALRAFQLYRRRPDLGLKSGKDTFGGGLPAAMEEKLLKGKPEDRLQALNRLIESWLARKLKALRLSPQEMVEWSGVIEAGRKQGMERLPASQNSGFAGQKNCAICDGATGACKLK